MGGGHQITYFLRLAKRVYLLHLMIEMGTFVDTLTAAGAFTQQTVGVDVFPGVITAHGLRASIASLKQVAT